MMNCSKCGNQVNEGTTFCNRCGNKIETVVKKKFCANCGAEKLPGARFCAKCGYAPNVQPNPAQDIPTTYAHAKKKSTFPVVIVVLLSVILLAGGVLVGKLIIDNQNDSENDESETIVQKDLKKEDEDEEEKEVEKPKKKTKKKDRKDDYEGKMMDESEVVEEIIDEEQVKVTEQPQKSSYLFPSDKRYITEYDLSHFTQDEVAMIRNEIYARHGYIFRTEPYKSYFEAKDWYIPNDGFNEGMLSELEKANKDTIVAYEEMMGWR